MNMGYVCLFILILNTELNSDSLIVVWMSTVSILRPARLCRERNFVEVTSETSLLKNVRVIIIFIILQLYVKLIKIINNNKNSLILVSVNIFLMKRDGTLMFICHIDRYGEDPDDRLKSK